MKLSATWLIAFLVCASLPPVAHGSDLADGEVNIPEIVAALETSDMSAQEIRTTASYTRLDVVDLSVVKSGDDSDALERALGRTDDGWAMIQTAIVSNNLIEQELRRRSIAMGRVVAATRSDAGVITIYTR